MSADSDEIVVTHKFIPWDAMSLEQRAEHLVLAHGYNDEWWWRSYKELKRDNDDDKVNAYLDSPNAVIVFFMVSAEHLSWDRMKEMHDEDHAEYSYGGGRCQHTHDKGLVG